MRVSKRSGSVEDFNIQKVRRCLVLAFDEHEGCVPELTKLLNDIERDLLTAASGELVQVNDIQDVVEKVLMTRGWFDVAKGWIKYRAERDRVRAERLPADNDALRDYVVAAKYARWLPELKRRENWDEICDRIYRCHNEKLATLIPDSAWAGRIVHIMKAMRQRKLLGSMRAAQFAGPALMRENERMYNCAWSLCDRPSFWWGYLYLLLCGAGVGYSVQWEHVGQLPRLVSINQRRVVHHSVEDTIVGWADALELLMETHMGMCEPGYVEFDYSGIRAEGEPLVVAGGCAPGHLGLKESLENIRDILSKASGRQMRPIEIYDINCHAALSVLSGGIRRSSTNAIFSATDSEMLYAKAEGNFRPAYGSDPGHNNQRQVSNNSAAIRGDGDYETFRRVLRVAEENFGDPGFAFLPSGNSGVGYNPCFEIGLDAIDHHSGKTGFAFCNLCEINVAEVEDQSEFLDLCRLAAQLGTLQSCYDDFHPKLGAATKAIHSRSRLLGVSLMGLMDNPELWWGADVKSVFGDDGESLLSLGASVVKDANKDAARDLGINTAERCCCVKPGGTGPKAVGCSSGITPRHARRYIVGVIATPEEECAKYFKSQNPHMVSERPDGMWWIEFPVEARENAYTTQKITVEEQWLAYLEVLGDWVNAGHNGGVLTHNVSTTITVRSTEDRAWLESRIWDYREVVSAISIVPDTLEARFRYAPLQAVISAEDEAHWNALLEGYKPIDWDMMNQLEANSQRASMEVACGGGKCDVT